MGTYKDRPVQLMDLGGSIGATSSQKVREQLNQYTICLPVEHIVISLTSDMTTHIVGCPLTSAGHSSTYV